MHHEPSRWARLLHTLRQPPAYIWLPNLLILGAMLATRGWPAATPAQLGAAGLLALLIALADRYPAELAERVALTGAPGLLLAGLALAGWPWLALAALAGTLAGGLLWRRPRALVAFEAGRRALAAALLLTIALATGLAGLQPLRTPLGLLGLALAMAAAYLAELSAALADSHAPLAERLRERAQALGWYLPALLLLGALVGALSQSAPWLALAGLAPLLAAPHLFAGQVALARARASLEREREQRSVLAQRVEHLQALAAAMVGARETPAMLELLCRRLAALLGAPAGWVVLLDERAQPQLMAQHNLPGAGDLAFSDPRGYRDLLESGRVVLVTDERWQALAPHSAEPLPEWSALLCIPLLGEGIGNAAPLLGAICLAFERLRGLDVDEKRVLTAFAHQAAVSIEHARLFDELRRKQAELIQSSKLAAVGTFAAGIAHEFNNLLGGMLGNAELGMMVRDPAEKDRALAVVAQAGRRGRSITRGLLTFARREQQHRAVANLADAIDETLALVGLDLQKARIRVELAVEPVPPTVCDLGQIAQVLLNLITNARDAMQPAGGTLTIGLRERAGVLELSVRDTGCGIAESIRDTIFEPFVTTKGAPGEHPIPGTGLGLSVSYGIVQDHGGTIGVESAPGRGTTMTVRLPLMTAELLEREMAA